ncbi:MAG: winged helix DNA-binding domain-containing protein [Actinomycetota bacterium]
MTRVDNDHRRRLLVHRHHVGAPGRGDRTIDDVVAALGLLHSTDPATPYLGLHARCASTPDDIDDAFYERRSLLRHTTIRRTVFAMPLDVAPIAHGAVNRKIVDTLRSQLVGWIDASPDTDVDAVRFLAETEDHVVASLRAEGPCAGTVLAERVPPLQLRFEPAPGKSYSRPMRITSKVLEVLAADGRIARGRPAGNDFTSAAWTWAPIDAWIDRAELDALDESAALTALVERYLRSNAPATLTDIAWWTGAPKRSIARSLTELDARRVELEHVGEPGYVCAGDELDAPPVDGAVALLPGLDPTTMGWKQRHWYVDDASTTGLFDRNGNAGPTVWIDGRVVGGWTQWPDGTIAVPPDGHTADLGAVAARLANWLGDVRVKWRYPTAVTKQLDTTSSS